MLVCLRFVFYGLFGRRVCRLSCWGGLAGMRLRVGFSGVARPALHAAVLFLSPPEVIGLETLWVMPFVALLSLPGVG